MASSSSRPSLGQAPPTPKCRDCYGALQGEQTQDEWITGHLLHRKDSCLKSFNRVILKYNVDRPDNFERWAYRVTITTTSEDISALYANSPLRIALPDKIYLAMRAVSGMYGTMNKKACRIPELADDTTAWFMEDYHWESVEQRVGAAKDASYGGMVFGDFDTVEQFARDGGDYMSPAEYQITREVALAWHNRHNPRGRGSGRGDGERGEESGEGGSGSRGHGSRSRGGGSESKEGGLASRACGLEARHGLGSGEGGSGSGEGPSDGSHRASEE
jgi:hypothetical protein